MPCIGTLVHLSNLHENKFSITLLLIMNDLMKDLHFKVSMDKIKTATKHVAATLLLFCFY